MLSFFYFFFEGMVAILEIPPVTQHRLFFIFVGRPNSAKYTFEQIQHQFIFLQRFQICRFLVDGSCSSGGKMLICLS